MMRKSKVKAVVYLLIILPALLFLLFPALIDSLVSSLQTLEKTSHP